MSWRSLLELAPLLPVTRYPIIVHPSIRWGKAECFSLCHADRWWEPIIDLIHNLWISVSRPWHVLFRGETSEDKLFSVFDLARIRGKDSPAESWTNGQLFIKKSQRVKLCSTFWQLSPAPATNLGARVAELCLPCPSTIATTKADRGHSFGSIESKIVVEHGRTSLGSHRTFSAHRKNFWTTNGFEIDGPWLILFQSPSRCFWDWLSQCQGVDFSNGSGCSGMSHPWAMSMTSAQVPSTMDIQARIDDGSFQGFGSSNRPG